MDYHHQCAFGLAITGNYFEDENNQTQITTYTKNTILPNKITPEIRYALIKIRWIWVLSQVKREGKKITPKNFFEGF